MRLQAPVKYNIDKDKYNLFEDKCNITYKEETIMVVKLTQDTYENEVMKAEGTVLVDFYADWCGPCKMQGPIVEQLAEERTDVKFCKLNIDEAMPIAMSLGITSIPTIMVVKDGEITFKQAGLMQKAQLNALL
jgi:thioredoxin 1